MTDWSRYFAIGSALNNIVTLYDLGIVEPYQDPYDRFPIEVEAADALTYGHGLARTAWRWGFIYKTQRDILKTYCAGKSAIAYTRLRDEDWDWMYCQVVMTWPKETPPIRAMAADYIIPEFILGIKVLQNYGASLP